MALQTLNFLTFAVTAGAITLSVTRAGGNATSPYMYGLTLDGLNSIDGLFTPSPTNELRPDLLDKLKALNPSFLRLPVARYSSSESANRSNLLKYIDLATTLSTPVILPLPPAGSSPRHAVQDSLNELEFLTGDVSEPFGALREELGYSVPWKIPFVEILGGMDARLEQQLCEAVRERYPDVGAFSSSKMEGAGRVVQEYGTPDELVRAFGDFDHSRGPIWVAGYAAVQENTSMDQNSPTIPYPTWLGAVAEAIFLLGAERNSDRVWGTSYAPLFQNFNNSNQIPALITYTTNPPSTTGSTSHRIIQLLSSARLTHSLPTLSSSPPNPAYWLAGRDSASYILKLATYTSSPSTTIYFTTGRGRTTRPEKRMW
ncbi:alpha-L-arabinofuranosidase C-terminus-domain-containing protein [Staphylotrichum tortipilum]|uniref:non-reducing end alpha-L-arabinofuranosidase n=1 Tax=Staphylotrichum tortipilum TaxID=2831512 RepID=A0AAN6MBG7_9PEZI|nr:alpha-L-arabinofuranosidase C-terminus-domain-containing protein [Staphylotrichum longicolle]